MRPRRRISLSEGRIDYKEIRRINPEAARRAVLEYPSSTGRTKEGNISQAGRLFGINRAVVYDIIKKDREGDLKDCSKGPKHQPRKTSALIEDKVIGVKNRTRLGPERLKRYLKQHEGLEVPQGTIRHILRRNKGRINYHLPINRRRKERRGFIDWYSAKPFEIVQMDIKHIRDQKALSKEQIVHLDRYHIPNYQWGALDVNSRFKLIGYSREKS